MAGSMPSNPSAGSGATTPSNSIIAPCPFSDSIKVKVVDDESGKAIADVKLDLKTPDGSTKPHTTISTGEIESQGLQSGKCDVSCDLKTATVDQVLIFVGIGTIPSGKKSTGSSTGKATTAAKPGTKCITKGIKKHKVQTKETLESVAKSADMDWKDLAKFNWGTDKPDEINKHLEKDVGCTIKTDDKKNYKFDDSDKPGVVYIPEKWQQTGLGTNQSHTIRVVEFVKDPNIKLVFYDQETKKPLSNMFIYVQDKNVPDTINEYELNDKGEIADPNKVIPIDSSGSTYHFFASGFSLPEDPELDVEDPAIDQPRSQHLFDSPNEIITCKKDIKNIYARNEEKKLVGEKDQDIYLKLRPLHKEIFQFRLRMRSSAIPKWTKFINKSSVCNDIIDRVKNPFKVKQADTPFCGPCSVVFELAFRRPDKYVRYLTELYWDGQFNTGGKTYKPSDKILSAPLPKSGLINQVDWMITSTIKDDSNSVFSPADASDVSGISTWKAVSEWVENLLGLKTSSVTTFAWGEIKAMEKARDVRNNKGIAILLIDMDLTDNDEEGVDFPTHWIVYLGKLIRTTGPSEKVSFNYYSWGSIRPFTNQPIRRLTKNLFAVVYGEK